jgi:hypothetical protein
MLQQTEHSIVHTTMSRLDDRSEDVKTIVIDLVRSGFSDIDELVALTQIAKDSILTLRARDS